MVSVESDMVSTQKENNTQVRQAFHTVNDHEKPSGSGVITGSVQKNTDDQDCEEMMNDENSDD